MRRSVLSIGVLLLLSSIALAGSIDYQGTGGNLNVAGNWYEISDINNPASHTGVTRVPTLGDLAYIRNATAGTINSAMSMIQLHVGAPAITGTATQAMTTLNIAAGSNISLIRRLGEDIEDAGLFVGGSYPGTLNMGGGTVDISGLASTRMWVGASVNPYTIGGQSVGTGVANITGGTITLQDAGSELLVGGFANSTGTMNLSGGSVVVKHNAGPDRSIRVGVRSGLGVVNLSGTGYLSNAALTEVGSSPLGGTSKATINQTGGTLQFGYRMIVGEDDGLGHYRLMGGTLQADGGLWLGRFKTLEPAPGTVKGKGKLTLSQNAVIKTALDGHLIMGLSTNNEAKSADHTVLELKLGSAADFNATFNFVDLAGGLEVSLTNGYAPAPGTDWKLFGCATSAAAAFTTITPGFHTEVRGTDLYLVAGTIRHSGDANNDGRVNVGDLGILAGKWGQTDFFGKSWDTGDFNGDDVVNVGDLGILAGAWGWVGTPAGATNVPEPATLALLVLGGLAMLRRRR